MCSVLSLLLCLCVHGEVAVSGFMPEGSGVVVEETVEPGLLVPNPAYGGVTGVNDNLGRFPKCCLIFLETYT